MYITGNSTEGVHWLVVLNIANSKFTISYSQMVRITNMLLLISKQRKSLNVVARK